jgi:hypothetical protein
VLFIKIAISFTSLIPCLVLPRELRETTERRAKRYRALAAKNSALLLRFLPKKVATNPKKVDSIPKKVKKVDYITKIVDIVLYVRIFEYIAISSLFINPESHSGIPGL